MTVTLDDVRAAAASIDGAVVRTPTVQAPRLSEAVGGDIELHLKLENQQFTGSFKDRGSLYRLQGLDAEARKRGVVAASAGNHAQGVAHHAQRLGIPATIVMPERTPFVKVQRTEALGANVVCHGASVSESQRHADSLAKDDGMTLIHPFDDERVIAGQGTAGLELLADAPPLDVVVVPIGGGGLMSGVATVVKALSPKTRVVGVQTSLCPSMHHAIRGLDASQLDTDTIAEGIAVKQPGAITRPIIEKLVDDILLVDEDFIEHAVQQLTDIQSIIAEGAGAAGLAAVMQHPESFAGKRIGLIICGGNIDSRLLSTLLLRGLRREGRLARFVVVISDSPGVLGSVTSSIGAAGGNIVELLHQRLFSAVPAKRAELDIVVEARGLDHVMRIHEQLEANGFPTRII